MILLFCKLILGLSGSTLIAIIAYLKNILTFSGVFATIFVGTTIALAGPWFSWVLIIIFFSSSSLITFLKKRIPSNREITILEKQEARDASQVLANSLPAIVSLLFFGLTTQMIFLIGYAAGIAGSTADTFASEIGVLSKNAPLSLSNFKKIQTGLSGGISLLGTIASFIGTLLIAATFYLLFYLIIGSDPALKFYLLIIIFSGFINSFFDSLLGAFFQVKYFDSHTATITEKKGTDTYLNNKIAGLTWMNNDLVNLFSGIFSVLFSFFLYKQFI